MRDPATRRVTLGLWACVWTILVSACFGVVLEGPMGAVVFWSLLGILNAPTPESDVPDTPDEDARAEKITPPRAAPLRTESAADEVGVTRTS
jgi:hypothetical protein